MPHIKLSTNLIILLLTLALEGLTLALEGSLVPERYVPHVMLAVAFIPKVLAILAQYSNPNGTPAALPYAPRTKAAASAAEAAYEAYRAQAGGRSLATGAPIPGWEKLPETIQGAWTAAAGAARVKR